MAQNNNTSHFVEEYLDEESRNLDNNNNNSNDDASGGHEQYMLDDSQSSGSGGYQNHDHMVNMTHINNMVVATPRSDTAAGKTGAGAGAGGGTPPIYLSNSSSPSNLSSTPSSPVMGALSFRDGDDSPQDQSDGEDDHGGRGGGGGGGSSKKPPKTPREIKKEKEKRKQKRKIDAEKAVPFLQLFRFSDAYDKTLMIFGTIAGIANGAAMPMVSLVFGDVIDVFNPAKFNADPNYSIESEVRDVALWFLYLGIIVFVLSYLETSLWTIAGERQTNKARVEYLNSILRQEIGWFDTNKAHELASRINSDTILFQEAIGEKVGHFLHNLSTFVAGFAIGFTKGWQLTLVIASVSPLLAIGGGIMAKMMTEMTRKGQQAYAVAGGIAEESIGSIRTVATFSAEDKFAEKYSHNLKDALKIGYKKSIYNGFGLGFGQFVILGTYALSFWYGSTLVSKRTTNDLTGEPWSGGDVVAVFFGVIIGATAIGQASPCLTSFANGRGAAWKIFQVIDRVSKANPFSTRGKRPENLTGEIEFRNVVFNYPSRPDVKIFNNFNLVIKPGETIGLVGDSGGGYQAIQCTCVASKDWVGVAGTGAIRDDYCREY
ncbi:ABC transporter B family protein [Cavenderia fasciculata]|uniref:ABC transporter B family protein n=1 Tax=Cavenderia fasciculata TaxID=261658 RepID=F4PLB5_CACFS|nr:ABC transporter B family protein [Cavenderia fasciculata]EGG23337.1 ABC transporter B family protein [Cavenderia fasciculata]|eukprot:XP_004361188.1 ABC transporter B family protein [Cavenderia fasciculata]